MADLIKSVVWEASEYHHTERKSSDRYWILGILAVSVFVVSVLLGNILFGILILLAASVITLLSFKEPRIIPFAVTARGIRIDDKLFPYSTLESFYLDEDNPQGPQLLVKAKRHFMPLMLIPIPADSSHEIETIIEIRLPEKHLEEPLSDKILEWLGF